MRIRLSCAAMPAGVRSGVAVILWEEAKGRSRGMLINASRRGTFDVSSSLNLTGSSSCLNATKEYLVFGQLIPSIGAKLWVTAESRVRLPIRLVPSNALPAGEKTVGVNLLLDSEELQEQDVVRGGLR